MIALFAQSSSQLWILASFYYNRNYIAANLCINRFDKIAVCKGSCFLEKQLNENKQEQEKLPDLKSKEITLFSQGNYKLASVEDFPIPEHIYPLYINPSIATQYLKSVFHPPCLVS